MMVANTNGPGQGPTQMPQQAPNPGAMSNLFGKFFSPQSGGGYPIAQTLPAAPNVPGASGQVGGSMPPLNGQGGNNNMMMGGMIPPGATFGPNGMQLPPGYQPPQPGAPPTGGVGTPFGTVYPNGNAPAPLGQPQTLPAAQNLSAFGQLAAPPQQQPQGPGTAASALQQAQQYSAQHGPKLPVLTPQQQQLMKTNPRGQMPYNAAHAMNPFARPPAGAPSPADYTAIRNYQTALAASQKAGAPTMMPQGLPAAGMPTNPGTANFNGFDPTAANAGSFNFFPGR